MKYIIMLDPVVTEEHVSPTPPAKCLHTIPEQNLYGLYTVNILFLYKDTTTSKRMVTLVTRAKNKPLQRHQPQGPAR